MSEITLYEAQKKKMEGLLDAHDLTYSFRKEQYPIAFTIRPIQGMDSQLSMLESADDGNARISPDAYMQWLFIDGKLNMKVGGGTFSISKDLRTKIENVLIKMISSWQQYFFRDVIENHSLRQGRMPVINEEEADDGDEDYEEPDTDSDDIEEDPEEAPETDVPEDADGGFEEALYRKAVEIVRMENKANLSLLQRRLKLGFTQASNLMDLLEARGVVGPYSGGTVREVLPHDLPDEEAATDE